MANGVMERRSDKWSAGLAMVVLLAFLTAGFPLFLCMPLWADATLYDLCALNLMQGGVLYRDILDTNLPGMVWLHLAIRSLLGWRSEVLRAVDGGIVAAVVWILVSWLRREGGSRAAGIWAALA